MPTPAPNASTPGSGGDGDIGGGLGGGELPKRQFGPEKSMPALNTSTPGIGGGGAGCGDVGAGIGGGLGGGDIDPGLEIICIDI